MQALEKEGLHPKYQQLDINDHSSIVRLRDFLQSTYGGLDVLVNNAGILYEVNSLAVKSLEKALGNDFKTAFRCIRNIHYI